MSFKNVFLLCAVLLLIFSCSKDKEEGPKPGIIAGIVSDKNDGSGLAEARIIIFNANTNSPTGEAIWTDDKGNYSIEMEPGNYFFKIYCNGYDAIPATGINAIPINVVEGSEINQNYALNRSAILNGGVIVGQVTEGNDGVKGALVIAEANGVAVSSVSDSEGYFYIYNVTPGDYSVKGWLAGYNSSTEIVSVTENATVSDLTVIVTNDAAAKVSGMVTFLATSNIEVDVALVHPLTGETIPGLNSTTTGGVYTIENVPEGDYWGRASYENDNVVMDPDWIVKNGQPQVTISGGDMTLDYSVTGAVSVVSPTNSVELVVPVEVSSGAITFRWTPYSSASDYVIEVTDVNGNLIWGGFSNDWSTKNIVIPSSTTSVEFNYDGSAIEDLVAGETYRWRIYASKDDKQAATGWRLISVSEDQMGLIQIID
ncbi:carboxypeptidase regulatory-like domain-containing protein [Carboxylicivirga mesophila]|uniref:Carboxypeptidase regulatory-like domain-containing protein n=1 Tax=Carboxylicivirga mesophila TaxID=1166478 RepID=A0ABS5KCT4_9BACT|nr:carboxypeptidase regulatory-like domain-containing protein [Carboxylicivirga mesophila]MBS2212850.1 carboxypeptidase regulatory-like domain-containing protein [Carboxylicivirga mesophila]